MMANAISSNRRAPRGVTGFWSDRLPNGCTVVICVATLLVGCTPPYSPSPYPRATNAGISGGPILTPDQTMDLENSDRIARFQRLASISGVSPPTVTQIVIMPDQLPGASRPIPVVRVVFAERILFDFNSDTPRPEAAAVLDLVADNMRRDVPDAQLTLLGHTDGHRVRPVQF
jgi:outer membrane protein OmpA-like peptidoglycan-associated protein